MCTQHAGTATIRGQKLEVRIRTSRPYPRFHLSTVKESDHRCTLQHDCEKRCPMCNLSGFGTFSPNTSFLYPSLFRSLENCTSARAALVQGSKSAAHPSILEYPPLYRMGDATVFCYAHFLLLLQNIKLFSERDLCANAAVGS